MDISLGVEKSIIINASKANIWRAITDPEFIKQYLFGADVISDWIVGSPIIFRGQWKGQSYIDKGQILDIQPESILSYNYWSAFSGIKDVPENYSIVTYTLSEGDEGVRLIVRQQGFTSEESRKQSDAGWEQVLEKVKNVADNL
ncbi:MAG: SRPBCC domain-containing protein [Saprospiraceae bacterium]